VLDASHRDGVNNDEWETVATEKSVVLWRSEGTVTLGGVEGLGKWVVALRMRKEKKRVFSS
jgi:hypothetical protein